ncbi:MAG: hypothetical protein E6Q33_01460 [Neisseriales bacterium]|nr:MAG: hypothetical protein E6Q33_01460 [Neisseriales bacterium]
MVKIADFGCATKLQESFLSKLYNLSYDKGTANYSSPQELMGLPYSARCDVWALGCLVYSLYFGLHPFSEITVAQTLAKIKELTENKKIIIK